MLNFSNFLRVSWDRNFVNEYRSFWSRYPTWTLLDLRTNAWSLNFSYSWRVWLPKISILNQIYGVIYYRFNVPWVSYPEAVLIIRIQEAKILRIRIQGVKNQPKTTKKNYLLLKPKSELLNGSSSFRIKISEKNKQKIWKLFFFVEKIQWILKKWPGSGSIFSSADPDPHQN